MHLDEGQIQGLAHGELEPGLTASLGAHLEVCAACREAVEGAAREEEEVHALLRHLDHPAPAVNAHALTRAAGTGLPGWGRWAAAVTLLLSAAAALYAAPGSPLPGWIAAAARPFAEAGQSPTREAAPVEPGGGLAVTPGERLLIQFAHPRAGGRATVSLTEGGEVEVSSLGGAPTFTSEADRILIGDGGADDFEIRIPWAAPRVEIRVGERPVFLKEGPTISTDAPAAGTDGYLLSLDGTGG